MNQLSQKLKTREWFYIISNKSPRTSARWLWTLIREQYTAHMILCWSSFFLLLVVAGIELDHLVIEGLIPCHPKSLLKLLGENRWMTLYYISISSFYTSHYFRSFISFNQVQQLMESIIRNERSETSVLVRVTFLYIYLFSSRMFLSLLI